jgi:hypothetical protein
MMEPISNGGGSSEGEILGMSSTFVIATAAILAVLAAGLLLIALSVLAVGSVSVTVMVSKGSEVVGRKKARKNHPYRFSVEGGREVTYRVGENGTWKEPVPDGEKYEIPKEDVRDALTVRVR